MIVLEETLQYLLAWETVNISIRFILFAEFIVFIAYTNITENTACQEKNAPCGQNIHKYLKLLQFNKKIIPKNSRSYEKIGLVLYHVIPALYQVRDKLQPGDRREAE